MRFPKQVHVKWMFVLVLASVLVTSGIVYVLAATPASTFWLAPGIYPGAPDYTIWREGNNYFAKTINGEIAFSGTDADVLINAALDSITSGKLVFDPDVFIVDAPIYLDGRSKTIEGYCGGIDTSTTTTKFYLADDANCSVFIIGSTTSTLARDMKLKHFTVEANKANNGEGHGIFVNGSVNMEEGYIEDVMVFDASEYGFSINAGYWTLFDTTADTCEAGGYYINGTDCYILDGDAYSCQANGFDYDVGAINARTTDSRAYLNAEDGFHAYAERLSFIGCRGSSNTEDGFSLLLCNQSTLDACFAMSNTGNGISVVNASYGLKISDCTVWNNGESGVYMDGGGHNMTYHVSMSGCLVSFSGEYGLRLGNVRDSLFVGNEIVDSGRDTDNTFYGVVLLSSGSAHSTENVFSANKIRDYAGNSCAWGWYETDANQDYNVFVGGQVTGQVTGNILQSGANSHVNLSWNGTSWVA